MNTRTSSPASFLFTTFEAGGVVAPILTLAAKLVGRGHAVRVISDLANGHEVLAAGARFIPWTRAPSRKDRSRDTDFVRDWEAATPQAGVHRLIKRQLFGPALEYAQDVIAELQREPADLVVSSEMLFGVMVACESLQQKLVLVSANLSPFPLPGVPPFCAGLAPARNDAERALHAEIAAGTEQMFAAGLPSLNHARQTLGLAKVKRIADQLHAAEAILLGTSRAFDFPADPLPSHVRYIGPLLGEPAWAETFASPWPATELRPLVLVAFSSTFQNHAGSLQNVIDALAKLPVRALVTSAGLNVDELSGTENVAVVATASHEAVMREASLVVTHGGHGTVLRALAHQLPMLILPQGRDQADNAVRVTERGTGISLMATASAGEIQAALSRLLNEASFTHSAKRLGRLVSEEAARSTVIADLEAFAGRSDHPFAERELTAA